jgi:rare lipoprotein A
MLELVAFMMLSQKPPAPVIEGVASYYTVASSSTVTASGETFRDDLLTCAMLEGEFGSYYRVVADNGRSVVVKLNDRGPYVHGRVIDLSKAAIRRLHPTDGLVNVEIFYLGKEPPPRMPPSIQ